MEVPLKFPNSSFLRRSHFDLFTFCHPVTQYVYTSPFESAASTIRPPSMFQLRCCVHQTDGVRAHHSGAIRFQEKIQFDNERDSSGNYYPAICRAGGKEASSTSWCVVSTTSLEVGRRTVD